MEFSIKNGNPEKQRVDCVIVGVFEGRKLTEAAKSLDMASNMAISAVLKSGDMDGKLNATVVLHQVAGVASARVMLVGLGKQVEFGERQYRQVVRAAVKALPKGVASAGFFLSEIAIKKVNAQTKAAQLVEVVMDTTYQVNAIKAKSTH